MKCKEKSADVAIAAVCPCCTGTCLSVLSQVQGELCIKSYSQTFKGIAKHFKVWSKRWDLAGAEPTFTSSRSLDACLKKQGRRLQSTGWLIGMVGQRREACALQDPELLLSFNVKWSVSWPGTEKKVSEHSLYNYITGVNHKKRTAKTNARICSSTCLFLLFFF